MLIELEQHRTLISKYDVSEKKSHRCNSKTTPERDPLPYLLFFSLSKQGGNWGLNVGDCSPKEQKEVKGGVGSAAMNFPFCQKVIEPQRDKKSSLMSFTAIALIWALKRGIIAKGAIARAFGLSLQKNRS